MSSVVLSNQHDVYRLLDSIRLWHFFQPYSIRLNSHTLTVEETARIESQLNRLANACGCAESVTGSLVAEACYLLYVYRIAFDNISIIILEGIAVFLLAGLIGKLLGLVFAKLLLRKRLRKLVIELVSSGNGAMGPQQTTL